MDEELLPGVAVVVDVAGAAKVGDDREAGSSSGIEECLLLFFVVGLLVIIEVVVVIGIGHGAETVMKSLLRSCAEEACMISSTQGL